MQTEILQQSPLFIPVQTRPQVPKPSFWNHRLWVRTTSSRSTQVLKPWLLSHWTWGMGRIFHALWLTTRSSSAQAAKWRFLGQGLQTQSPSSCMLVGHGFPRMQRPVKKSLSNMFFLGLSKDKYLNFKNMSKLRVKFPLFWFLYLDFPSNVHYPDQARDFLSKPQNENKALEFRLSSGEDPAFWICVSTFLWCWGVLFWEIILCSEVVCNIFSFNQLPS